MTPDKKAITILVCDDDPVDRALTQQALDAAGVPNPVRFVEDGAQLLDYLYRRGAFAGDAVNTPRPGLILLDLNLPKMSGLQALTIIKGDAPLQEIPVVVLAASEREEDVARSYQRGVNSYIAKPRTFPELVVAMTVLGRYWLDVVALPPARE